MDWIACAAAGPSSRRPHEKCAHAKKNSNVSISPRRGLFERSPGSVRNRRSMRRSGHEQASHVQRVGGEEGVELAGAGADGGAPFGLAVAAVLLAGVAGRLV